MPVSELEKKAELHIKKQRTPRRNPIDASSKTVCLSYEWRGIFKFGVKTVKR
jgi:hypothetical protein|tara:strand:- start:20727 stop:20882 length:156 start_codon:yes stop_codon:yes gene_type:complete